MSLFFFLSVSLKHQAHNSPPERTGDEAFIIIAIAKNRYREYPYIIPY